MEPTVELTSAEKIAERLLANEPPMLVEKELPILYDEPMPDWFGLALLVMPSVEAAYTFLKIWLRPEELDYMPQSFLYYHAEGRMDDHAVMAAFEVFSRAAYQNHPIFQIKRRKEPHFLKNRKAITRELLAKRGQQLTPIQFAFQGYGLRLYCDAVTLEELSAVANGLLKNILTHFKKFDRELYNDILKLSAITRLRHKPNQKIVEGGGLDAMLQTRTEAAIDFLMKKYAYNLLTHVFKMAQSEEKMLQVRPISPKKTVN